MLVQILSKEFCLPEKSFKNQLWLVSPPLLITSIFPSLASRCLLSRQKRFKLLSACSSFILASDCSLFRNDYHPPFLQNGLFAITIGSQNWSKKTQTLYLQCFIQTQGYIKWKYCVNSYVVPIRFKLS